MGGAAWTGSPLWRLPEQLSQCNIPHCCCHILCAGGLATGYVVCSLPLVIERQRLTNADRQEGRQTDSKTARHTDRHKQTDRQTDRNSDRKTDRQAGRPTDRQPDSKAGRQTDRIVVGSSVG